MSGSDRGEGTESLGILSATVVALIIGCVMGFTIADIGGDIRHRADSSARYKQATKEHIQDTCINLEPVDLLDCVVQAQDASREYQRSEQDVDHQRRMADASWLMMLASILAFFATTLGIFLLWQTLKATRDTLEQATETTEQARLANKVTKEIGIEQNRARMHFEGASVFGLAEGTVHKIDESGTINFQGTASISNIGKTAARFVRAKARMRITESNNYIVMETEFSKPLDLGIVQGEADAEFGSGIFRLPAVQPFILPEHYEALVVPSDYIIFLDVYVEYTDVYFIRRYTKTGFMQWSHELINENARFTRVTNRDEEGIIESPDEHDDYGFPD